MGAPIATMVIGSIVIGVFSRQLADEFKAWTPWLVRKLVAFAVRRLPVDRRERYSEEWTSYTEEIPGEIGKILAALTLPWGAMAMKVEFLRQAKTEADTRLYPQWAVWLIRRSTAIAFRSLPKEEREEYVETYLHCCVEMVKGRIPAALDLFKATVRITFKSLRTDPDRAGGGVAHP